MNIRETEADREVQNKAKEHIERYWAVELVATRTLDPYDFDAYDGQKRVALIEVRRRNNDHAKYPNYWISYEKYKQLRLLGEAFCVPVYFLLVFDDGMFIVDLMELSPNPPTSYGDRGVQRDPRATDKEKVVGINLDEFIRLG